MRHDQLLTVNRLKHDLECELHRARPAHLVQGAQNTQRIRKSCRRLPERRLSKVAVYKAKIWMIEDIESFRAKLQAEMLMNRELAANRQIHLPSSKTSGKVAWGIAETAAYGREGIWIDGPPAWASLVWQKLVQSLQNRRTIGAVKVNRLAGNKTETGIILPSSDLRNDVSHQGDRERGPHHEAIIDSPVVQ